MSETKIVGIKKAAHDMLWAPKGFHCEIWAKRIDRYVRQYKDMGYNWTASIRITVAEVFD